MKSSQELLVCDRIKSTLTEGCLKHILTIESSTENGWLPLKDLAEAVDLYYANRWQHGERPRAGAIGIPASTRPAAAALPQNRFVSLHSSRPLGSASNDRGTPIVKAVESMGNRRCFNCGSKSHLKNECPKKGQSVSHRDNTKVHACQIQNRQGCEFKRTPVSGEPVLSANVRDAEVQVCTELNDTDNTTVDVHEVQSQTVGMNDDLCDDYAKLQYVKV